MENVDRDQYQAMCFSDGSPRGQFSLRFQQAATSWNSVETLTDEQLAASIRQLQIDILFDLRGHSPRNRLLVFARRPAPIQVTWIDSVGTTGLSAIDYLLADPHLIPENECRYAEKVLRLPETHVCYEPPREAPEVASLPALRSGFVTFGSFNQPAKINGSVVNAWSRILRNVPDSRLVLKYRGFESPSATRYWRQLFCREGVGGHRIECEGRSPIAEYLGEYNNIDVSLDPFPHNGSVTTCHSLWMGAPVVTIPGETFASRQSLSHLSNVGLTETIASNLEEYVEVAVGLARDLPRLARIRATLRERMAASPLCDGKRFAQNLQSVLRSVWREWCQKQRSGGE